MRSRALATGPDAMTDQPLHKTPLHDLHVELGAKIVPFAGYAMPVQYEGIMAEHNHTREAAGLYHSAGVAGPCGACEATYAKNGCPACRAALAKAIDALPISAVP